MRRIQDVHVLAAEPLIAPHLLKNEMPADEGIARTVVEARETIREILADRDRRMLCIVGPCSIHDPDAAIDYARRLAKLKAAASDRLYIIMRVYFEKPRTTVGWKGLINDPHMDDSCDMREGLRIARRLLIEINRLGLAAGTELLDPITPQYIADLVAWAAIGARTTESQTHREMASGLSMPVGFKNTTEGNLQVAINAIQSARRPHSFLGITQDGISAVIRTSGNPDTHIVLRGGRKPNYDAASIEECRRMLASAALEPRMMVDCSHAQTSKDFTKQPAVLRTLIDQVRAGSRAIMGAMLESNLEAGSQPLNSDRTKLKYGVSVTDPCIDWPTTEQCMLDAAGALGASGAIATASHRAQFRESPHLARQLRESGRWGRTGGGGRNEAARGMTAKESSQAHSAAESLTSRPLLIFLLFAIEILAIDFLKLPDIMAFDHYAFCDAGANLTLQYVTSHGLRPTIDFGYNYGLLPILVGRIWFGIAGITPISLQVLMTVCDLVIAWAIAKIVSRIRFGAVGLALIAITLGFAVQASYPSLAQAVEAVLLVS